MTRRNSLMLLVVIILSALTPVVGKFVRSRSGSRCALDGIRVEDRLRVLVHSQAGEEREFCSLRCAECWVAAAGWSNATAFVTDEESGEQLRASEAYFVRSRIVTHRMSGERRHVFRNLSDAEKHAELHQGRLLIGKLRPFATIETETSNH